MRILVLLIALVTLAQANSAHAAFGITSVVGGVQLPGPPAPNVHLGSNESVVPIVFHEVLNAVVTSRGGLAVDHNGSAVSAVPIISGNVVNSLLIDAIIPSGTRFNSYLFHFDPLAIDPFGFFDTTINFDHTIIGVQLFSDGFVLQKPSGTPYTGTLEQGDFEVAANGGPGLAYYPGGVNYRGVEEDALQLIVAGNSLRLAGSVVGNEIDQVRILTAAVPEPASGIAWLLTLVVGCVAAYVYRRS
jgi:hypothetical protein